MKEYWNIEDTFFGAIFGAFLGVVIDEISVEYVVLLIIFFILFPVVIRKAELFAKNIWFLVGLCCIAWVTLFFYELSNEQLISTDQFVVFIVVFMGWLISLASRVMFRRNYE